MSATVYVVATPIGNLGDLSERARQVLCQVDVIAAEDTRHTRQLLTHFDIHTPLISNHQYNEAQRAEGLLERLRRGESVALVTDAGTPCVSDPGYALVAAARREGFEVVTVPGPCAVAAGLSISGLPSGTFAFLGFAPRQDKGIAALADKLAALPVEAAVLYESPQRVRRLMAVLAQRLGEQPCCALNDMTKRHERAYTGTVAQVAAQLADNPDATLGEYCIVIALPQSAPEPAAAPATAEQTLLALCLQEGLSLKEAVARAAAENRLPRKLAYQASLRLKDFARQVCGLDEEDD